VRASVLDSRPPRELAFVAVAVAVSMAAHGAVATGVSQIEPREHHEPVWVEVAVQPAPVPEVVPEPEPEPEPVPEPEPEPEPLPEPEVVQFEETTPEPVPPTPVPPRPLARPIQGLDPNSFAPGAGGPVARAGNTTATRATSEIVAPEDVGEYAIVPYTGVAKAPRIGSPPRLTVPQSVIDSQVQGRVEVELTIGADGSVQDVVVVSSLSPEADAACVADLRRTKWRPGAKDDVPVVVTGVPYSCRYEMAVD